MNATNPEHSVVSSDGTVIAYQQVGAGPVVVIVSGATCTGAADAPLAALLAERFTAVTYDRRGRGASGDTRPYTVAREVEDLAALIAALGGSAALFGMSSGGALALEAAAAGLPVTRVAAYELPFTLDEAGVPDRLKHAVELRELLAAGRNGDAVAHFLVGTGMPQQAVDGMRRAPWWGGMEAVAPTLAYDFEILGDCLVPVDRLAQVRVPVLVATGGDGSGEMGEAGRAAAQAAPDGRHRLLPGQTHQVAPEALAPVLLEFLGG
ncbi:alpha/beta fold hydrolase [Streptacidiphilus sp. PAMC 29251]